MRNQINSGLWNANAEGARDFEQACHTTCIVVSTWCSADGVVVRTDNDPVSRFGTEASDDIGVACCSDVIHLLSDAPATLRKAGADVRGGDCDASSFELRSASRHLGTRCHLLHHP